jgi:hypothetical protein
MKNFLAKFIPSNLAPSVQRRMLELMPVPLLDRWCWSHPKFVIELLCNWISEKNPDIEGREIAPRKSTALVAVAKKLSKLSVESFTHLLQQDESLWRFYSPPAGFTNMKTLPYIILEIIYDLGGSEGRKKVVDIIQRSRQALGGKKQGDMLENFKTDMVIEIFENMPEFDVRMRLMFNDVMAVAFWLDHWDRKMKNLDQPEKSAYWLGKLPGKRAYEIESLLRKLEFRRKFTGSIKSVYDPDGK